MATVNVKLGTIGPSWTKACHQAVKDLNELFKRKGVDVQLSSSGGGKGPAISVSTDPAIIGTAVHGNTSAKTNDAGRLLSADVRLPVKVVINSPSRVRDAGLGILEVIAAHEFVHALGQEVHNSHLMARTMNKMLGNWPGADKLQAGSIQLPPLQLADESIDKLKEIWN